MRIALITDVWTPLINGVVTTLENTVRILREKGHEVLVLSPDQFPGLPCPTYPEIRLALFPWRKVARILDDYRPDAVHIANEGPLGWAGRFFCWKRGKGFTTAYHTRLPEYIRLRFPVPLQASYAFFRWFHKPSKAVMTASPELMDELHSRGFSNLKLWSRGVDTGLFRPRSKDYLDAPRPISMFMGRVAVEKNIEDFLRLDIPGTKYVVGDGPAFAKLKAAYPDVRFVGAKRGEELAAHLAAADVFVFPSTTDTFGLVLLEAMACGVPVAAYPVTGPQSVVVHGQTGWLSEDLQEAVHQALPLSPQACRIHAETYSWERCTEQFLGNLHLLNTKRKDG
ncbi:Glycosyltransferase involved in cell wall bisynthesis [Desulfonatronum zhilinae]|nr:Glycosyltransferase involved in cell wall bisynthesis [Desulfonatronum zhilinae]